MWRYISGMQCTLETTVSIMVVSINILTAPECLACCTTSLLDFPSDSSRRRSTCPSDEGWREGKSQAMLNVHGNQVHIYSQDHIIFVTAASSAAIAMMSSCTLATAVVYNTTNQEVSHKEGLPLSYKHAISFLTNLSVMQMCCRIQPYNSWT